MRAEEVPVTIEPSTRRSKLVRDSYKAWVAMGGKPHYSPSGLTAKLFGEMAEADGLKYEITLMGNEVTKDYSVELIHSSMIEEKER